MNDEDRLVYLLGCTRREIDNLSTPKWMPTDTVWLLLEEVKRYQKTLKEYDADLAASRIMVKTQNETIQELMRDIDTLKEVINRGKTNVDRVNQGQNTGE